MHRSPAARGPAPARGTRATVVGVAAVLIAVLGHASGGGGWPSGSVAVPVLVAGALAGVALSRVTWTVLRVVAALAAAQATVHTVLWLGSASTAVDPRLASLVTRHAEPHAHAALSLTPHMLAGHAVAIALTAVVLVSAERAALLLAHLARRLAPRRTHVDLPHALSPVIRWSERNAVVPRLLHLVTVRGHAPPSALLALT